MKIAQKITWTEPEQDTITNVEISRSTTIHGTYTVLDTIDATSDGAAKSSSNTWVTSYVDSTGTSTHWYKIRFYDATSTFWSDYSDPITAEELARLCTVDDVKEAIDTVGRWTDTEIFDAISVVDENIYFEMGTPIKAVYSDVGYDSVAGTTYKDYFVGEQNVYRVDRLFVGTTTKTELFMEDGYRANLTYGMIRILPYASSGFSIDRTQEVEIHFVPKIYNRLATYRTAKMLLEQIDTITGGSSSKELEVVQNRLDNVEQVLMNQVGVVLSSDYANYDPVYGVNLKKIRQNFDRNAYFAKYGW